jgi:arylsulfatase A-like enzyme
MAGMTRRSFVAGTAAFAAGACVGGAASGAPPRDKPNVLIFLTDQHRIDCLGAYGNRDIHTPHIDALAAEGVRFNNSFCPYPVCTPSRYSLISGLYVHEHRGWTNHCTLPPGTETFPAILKKAGYRTRAVGKMHYTPTYFDVGFSEMALAEQNGPGRWDDDYHRALKAQGLIDGSDLEDQETEYRKKARPEYWETFGAMPSNLPRAWHSTEWIGDRAAETLRGWEGSGQLLQVGFIKPHHPFDPPTEYARLYDAAKLNVLPGWTEECFVHDLALSKGYFPHESLTEPALRRVMAHYYACIQEIDDQVGRMIGILKEKGIYDNTLIVFTADHGEYLGHHHLLLKGNYMYDPLVKVPLIIRFPGGKNGGTISDGLVNTTDVAPTILAQAGCPVPAAMRGLNLAENRDQREIVFAESNEGKQVMARTKTRKLILHRGNGLGLLYDLEKDPCELDNRFDDPGCQHEVQSLTEAMDAWRGPGGLSTTYLDEKAPVIDQPNVPDRQGDHRRVMVEYTREKMREDWAKAGP